jgi:hypothetical protein
VGVGVEGGVGVGVEGGVGVESGANLVGGVTGRDD